MYEFRGEPSPGHIMRHQAWQLNQAALAQCRSIGHGPDAASPVHGLITALGLLGRPVPSSFRLATDRPYIVVPDASGSRIAGTYRKVWKPLRSSHAIIAVEDIRCTSPAATFAHMARHCSFEHLVALGDMLTCRDRSLRRATIADIRRFLEGAGKFVGHPDAERALRLVRENTDSPAETRLRLMAMRFGLPCPQPDVVIAQDPWQIRIDMGWPQYRVGLDYQGAHHRSQYEDDLARANAILASGWTVFQVTGGMIAAKRTAYELFELVATALRKAGAPIEHAYVEPMSARELTDRPVGRPRRDE